MKSVIFVQFDDREPHIEYIDTAKLNMLNPVDEIVAKGLASQETMMTLYAENWEDDPRYPSDGNIGISAEANIDKPEHIDSALILQIVVE